MTLRRMGHPLALTPALIRCAWLASASAHAAGTLEAAPSENLGYQAGLEAIKSSDGKRAIGNLNVAAVAEPTNADLQYWLGYSYRHEGNERN
jgi:hypothetical protein